VSPELRTVLAAVLGGLLVLERKTVGPFLLARPIVVSVLVGAALGDPAAALPVGLAFELFFLGAASFGGISPDHETIAALFASALVAAITAIDGVRPSPDMLAMAVFLALPLAPVGRVVESFVERRSSALVGRTEDLLERGALRLATRQALLPLGSSVFLGTAVTALGVLAAPGVVALSSEWPSWAHRGLRVGWFLFAGLSAALAIRTIRTPGAAALSGLAALSVFVFHALVRWLQ